MFPRCWLLRPGDSFSGGCTVNVLEGGTVTVHVQLAGTPWLALVGPRTITLAVEAGKPIEVLFRFRSNGVGNANVTFAAELNRTSRTSRTSTVAAIARASASTAATLANPAGKHASVHARGVASAGSADRDGESAVGSTAAAAANGPLATDAFKVNLPLLGTQDLVRLATSFAIDGSQSNAPWQEGITFPAAVNGSGNVALSVSVGHSAAIQSACSNVEEELSVSAVQWRSLL